MKKFNFDTLPSNVFFWRENNIGRWLKTSELYALPIEETEVISSKILKNEIVLLDPNFCQACFAETKNWPPNQKCYFCGDFDSEKKILR